MPFHTDVFFSFQSTLPRRERLCRYRPVGDVKADFNPRSREGSDEFTQWQTGESVISIHAPAKGATWGI